MTPPVELVFKSDETSAVNAKLVVVAFWVVSAVAFKTDEVALVFVMLVAKRFVEVAFVVVPLRANLLICLSIHPRLRLVQAGVDRLVGDPRLGIA